MSVNKTEKKQTRYRHWFWNSCLISYMEGVCLKISNWLWQKQYNRY